MRLFPSPPVLALGISDEDCWFTDLFWDSLVDATRLYVFLRQDFAHRLIHNILVIQNSNVMTLI